MALPNIVTTTIRLSPEFRSISLSRADIIFSGIDVSGASFQARIFFNNPDANHETPLEQANGYAGIFHVFGQGGCFGNPGHCDVPVATRPYDLRRKHDMTPIEKRVIITNALEKVFQSDNDHLRITIVPAILSSTEKCNLVNVLTFESIDIVAYKS